MPFLMTTAYPQAASLRDISRPLPNIPADTVVAPASIDADDVSKYARRTVDAFNTAIDSADMDVLSDMFYEQVYWRDSVALTSHLRTMNSPRVVASALLQTIKLRGLQTKFDVVGDPHFAVVSPSLMFIDCGISFETASPALRCAGRMLLLPVERDGMVDWRVWVLSTWVEDLLRYPEDRALLSLQDGVSLERDVVETDVVVIGAGTAGLMTAARLKAFGVGNIVVERNAVIGSSWANRYDSARLHVPASNCEMPYIGYRKDQQSPYLLSKDDIADHLQQYASHLALNVLTSATITTTTFNTKKGLWTLQINVAGRPGVCTVLCKHLVQATGLGSSKPLMPQIPNSNMYKGVQIHSANYRNAHELKQLGVQTVAIIGSANTAFDVMSDCWDAGLNTTMVVRSPTYILPYDYLADPRGIGAYNTMPLDTADRLLNTLPYVIDGQFSHGLFAHLASREPDRYKALRDAGFPVLDSRDASVNILHNLLERGGGHYLDVGGTELIAGGKVKVRGMVEPVAYTAHGLRLSDDSVIDVDAVVWCTGFADKDVKGTAAGILGRGGDALFGKDDLVPEENLGPEQIAARLDATMGVDIEGEVRGVGKRHLRVSNYWVIGGTMQHQRWWSRAMVQQIKLAVEGDLPPAYRDTPNL